MVSQLHMWMLQRRHNFEQSVTLLSEQTAAALSCSHGWCRSLTVKFCSLMGTMYYP